jgi:hypothetical protein
MAGKFEGTKCIVCSQPFTDSADVVVCPDCGARHHRSCYVLEGQCVNTEKHGQIEQLERALGALNEFRKARDEVRERVEALDFEEKNIYGASKAELSAFMCIEPDTPEFKQRVVHAKVVNMNIYAGLLSPFYQFSKGMRLIGFALLLMVFLQILVSPVYFPALPLVTILMLLFNDYVYLRHCAFKIRMTRKFYDRLPEELKGSIEYYELLRLKGKPGVLRGILETVIAFVLMILLLQYTNQHFGIFDLLGLGAFT